ncbi:MAG: hypothetical protein JKY46_06415, partial [Robiginitomaculum sp.]|nr:hypothetical protein [Robiginitomaculum sp.]
KSVTVSASNSIGRTLQPISIDIPAGEAREARWQVLVPYDHTEIQWQIQVIEEGSDLPSDNMIVAQKIVPAIPVTVLQSTIARLNTPQNWPVAQAIDALPGRGGLELKLQSKLGSGLDSVEDFMRSYPYTCFEQRTSVAIALNDTGRWQTLMAAAPAFLDADGLLKYFVSDNLRGSDVLTAYVLKIADEAGWEIDQTLSDLMLNGLTAFVEGRLDRPMPVGGSSLTYRKLSAINALSRYGKGDAQILDTLEINAKLLPTSALLDWIDILENLSGIANVTAKTDDAYKQLRVRLDLSGTNLRFSTERDDRLWWLMETIDANAARTLMTTQELDDWQDDAPRLTLGLLSRQKYGRWQTTTANAWGMLAMRKFSAEFEKNPVTGNTEASYGQQSKIINWPEQDNPPITKLDWVDGTNDLNITHQGAGTPWVFVTAKAAVPFKQPISAGYHIKRTITAIEQKSHDSWQVGDVMKIHLEITANADMTWVVIDDPVPAGATILGKGLDTESRRLSQTTRTGNAWPVYTERKFEVYRSYYRYVPKGTFTLEYTIRLNTVGNYQLPPARVEAMYAPEIFGAVPIAELVIE